MRWALSRFIEDGSETLSGKWDLKPGLPVALALHPPPFPVKTTMAKMVLQAAPRERALITTGAAAGSHYRCQVCTPLSCAGTKPRSCRLSPEDLRVGQVVTGVDRAPSLHPLLPGTSKMLSPLLSRQPGA